MNRNHLLYVENISPSSSEEHLITYLEKWAPIQQVYFLREKQCTKRSIAAFVRVGSDADLEMLMSRNQQNYRGKRLFMVRVDQTPFFQADHSVIVRNITSKISEENLYDHFEECGKIAFLQIRTDDFAYIGFEEKSTVRNAMSKNNLPLKGSNLKIQLLTRNIEIMIVNLDTLPARMPDLYRKMILPIEPRESKTAQQSEPPQQQQSQPARQQQQQQSQKVGNQNQQQFGNQQQQSQQPRQQQQFQPQNQNQQQHNQRQQQQQNQRQQQQQNQPQQQQQRNQPQQQQQRNQPQQQQQQQRNQPQQQNQRQQQQQNQRQQQPHQQQQNQRQQQPQQQQQNQRVQPQQQPLPQRQQQQPLPQRQQQQAQPERQQMSTIQLLKERANTLADKQQKPSQQAAVQTAKAVQPVQEEPTGVAEPAPVAALALDDNDDVQIIEPMETTEILVESDSETQIIDTSVVPPIPSAYKPKPNDLMRPVKATEIALSDTGNKKERDRRSLWVNNLQPETRRIDLVLYMEQFGPVEMCKIGSSSNCYFTRWAKVTFTSEESAKRASEYFLHPFQGRYLFVLACNKCIDAKTGKVFVLDYLSKYLVYEDVVKSFKHVGDVFYLVRLKDNSHKVRIFFLNDVNADAVLAVKSIGGIPINVQPYQGADLELSKEQLQQFKKEREVIDPKKKARMEKIFDIYNEEMLNRCDPVANPDGKTEGNVVLMTNVHRSTSDRQIVEFFQSVGKPVFIRREKDVYNVDYERIFVGFHTLSLVINATEMAADKFLNGYRPFVFAAWTKPHMTERNAMRFFLESKDYTIQDVYDQLIQFGKIRYIEREKPSCALVVFDACEDGLKNAALIQPGFCIGKTMVRRIEPVIGKRTHQSAFSDSENEHPAKSNFNANSRSNTHPEIDPDVTLIMPVTLDDSGSEQQPATVDIPDKTQHSDGPVRDLQGLTFITGTWNVAGCSRESDRAHVDSLLSSNGVIVGGLQDTRMSTGTMTTANYHWFNVNRNAESARIEGGVALVVRRDLMPDCNFRQVSDDICTVRLPVFGKMLTVVCVFARFLNDPDPAIETLHDFLSGLRIRQRANVVVLGDFKAHIGIQDLLPGDRQAIGKFLFHPWSNTNGVGIQNILRCHNLRLSSSFGPCSSVLCTRSQDDQKSQTCHIMMPIIDRFLRPACRSVQDASGFSDHHLLLMTVKYRVASAAISVETAMSQFGFKPYNVEKLPQDSIVIDDEDDVVEISNKTPSKNAQSKQQNQKDSQYKQQQQQQQQPQLRPPPERHQRQQQQHQRQPNQQRQQQQQQQRYGRDRNRNPFADNRSPQRNPFQDQRRSMNPWDERDNQEAMWNEQQFHQQQQRDDPMSDNRFNRYNDGPFDMMDQGGHNMNEFDQMMIAQQFGMFSMNQQNDNGFNNCGPMDSDDPPLDRPWGNQQQNFNRFSPPRQRSPFERGFRNERDDDELSFGRDSPGIPPNIPDDEIDEYIMRKQEAIKRRLEQLDKQLITSVESSRHRDFDKPQRRRKGTVFSDSGDVHYVPNPAAVARNRDRRGVGGSRRSGRGSGNGEPRKTQNQRRERTEMHRKKDPFADVDIVPIIRISEERSPSPKRNREDAFDPAQFDAAWC